MSDMQVDIVLAAAVIFQALAHFLKSMEIRRLRRNVDQIMSFLVLDEERKP